jgi:hypothetical protein
MNSDEMYIVHDTTKCEGLRGPPLHFSVPSLEFASRVLALRQDGKHHSYHKLNYTHQPNWNFTIPSGVIIPNTVVSVIVGYSSDIHECHAFVNPAETPVTLTHECLSGKSHSSRCNRTSHIITSVLVLR